MNDSLPPPRSMFLLIVGTLLVSAQVATQSYAYKAQYAPVLGTHWYQWYPPWSILQWQHQWPEDRNVDAAFGLGVTVILGMVLVGHWRPKSTVRAAFAWLWVIALCGGGVATQVYAHWARYHPWLGPHWHHLYPPWAIARWLLDYHLAWLEGGSGLALVMVVSICYLGQCWQKFRSMSLR